MTMIGCHKDTDINSNCECTGTHGDIQNNIRQRKLLSRQILLLVKQQESNLGTEEREHRCK